MKTDIINRFTFCISRWILWDEDIRKNLQEPKDTHDLKFRVQKMVTESVESPLARDLLFHILAVVDWEKILKDMNNEDNQRRQL